MKEKGETRMTEKSSSNQKALTAKEIYDRGDAIFVDARAAEEFKEKGWRVTVHGNVYCPNCAKKKLKT